MIGQCQFDSNFIYDKSSVHRKILFTVFEIIALWNIERNLFHFKSDIVISNFKILFQLFPCVNNFNQ